MDAHLNIAIGWTIGALLSAFIRDAKSEAIMSIVSVWGVYLLVWVSHS